MQKRLIILYVFLFSYSGAILHSIVPHHHHNSNKEAKGHHHHDHQTSHSHGNEDKDSNNHEHNDSLYFLTHSSNADISVSQTSGEGAVKIKKAEKLVTLYTVLPVFSIVPSQQIFHPPSDGLIPDNSHYLFSALRAPPSFIA